jgi:formate dehydrogenase assembly factor FdhD
MDTSSRTRDIEQYTPHAKVEYAPGLAKHAAQTIAGPLERAAVAQDTERHLGLDHLSGALVSKESEKIGVR